MEALIRWRHPQRGLVAPNQFISMAEDLGKIMDLKIIAEGIETEEQLEFMRQTNCDAYQGFYFSPPLPEAEITERLKQHSQADGSETWN